MYKSNKCNYSKAIFNVKSKNVSIAIASIIKKTLNYIILKRKKSLKAKIDSFSTFSKLESLNTLSIESILENLLNIAQVLTITFYHFNNRSQ